jgi:methyltransferase (TIGR00027 family)
MSVTLPVESVHDTAFLTALWRAIETERADAHFRDPYARLLAGTRGEQYHRRWPGGQEGATGCIVRTCLFDALILQTMGETPIDSVINLGAGLDTRPYRLPLAASLNWIEVDSAAVLRYKASKLEEYRPACAVEVVPMDLMDRAARRDVFERIAAKARQVLVVTEGLLVYMSEEQVASLARDLHEQPAFQWWLCDILSPIAFQVMAKLLGQSPPACDVKLQFAPEQGSDFFQQYGWKCVEFRSCLQEGIRLHRWPTPDALVATLSAAQLDALRRSLIVAKLRSLEQ